MIAALAAALVGGAGAGLYVVDRFLARSGRIGLDAAVERFATLQDAIYCFAEDKGEPPASLAELVPAYAPESFTRCRPDPRDPAEIPIRWVAEKHTLSWPRPYVLRGLFTRRIPIEAVLQFRPVAGGPPPNPTPPNCPGGTAPVRDTPAVMQVTNTAPYRVAPADTIVLEAERFQHLTHGWEIGTDPLAAGGAYLHNKEGAGDCEVEYTIDGTPFSRVGDVYNVTGDMRAPVAELRFMVPRTGVYHLYARTMAQRMRCSNLTGLTVNHGERLNVGRKRSRPFWWLWHRVGDEGLLLTGGVNTVSFRTVQDDVKVDQLVFSPHPLGLAESEPRVLVGGLSCEPVFPQHTPPVCLSLSAESLNVVSNICPAVTAWLRRLHAGELALKMTVSLRGPRGETDKLSTPVKLEAGVDLVRVDLPRFKPPADLGDFLLRVAVIPASGPAVTRTRVLSRPYDWRILGPLPYLWDGQEGPLDGEQDVCSVHEYNGRAYTWQRYDAGDNDPFGLMDFGQRFTGNRFLAPEQRTVYARTEVNVPAAGRYRVKGMGDDDMTVWINGRHVLDICRVKGPAIRSVQAAEIDLPAGRATILYRLNQRSGQWQGKVFFRGADHGLTGITGIPFEHHTFLPRGIHRP